MSTHPYSCVQKLCFLVCFTCLLCLNANGQSRFDSDPSWPLCGNWYLENLPYSPYNAMTTPVNCDPTRLGADFADLVQVPYGPRHIGPSLKYDWHRGLDLPTKHTGDIPEGSRRPVYAMAEGRVLSCEKSDPSSSNLIPCTTADSETTCLMNPGNPGCDNFPDIRLLIEHERPDSTSRCAPSGCYYTRYVHLSRVLPAFVNPMDTHVDKGEFLGLTGHSETGTFNHLHFEIRSSIANETDLSQREAINPLTVLPFVETPTTPCADNLHQLCDPSLKVEFALPNVGVIPNTFGSSAIDLTATPPTITVRASVDPFAGSSDPADATDETDLSRIEIRISELQNTSAGGMQLVDIPQGSQTPETPEHDSYILDPGYLDHQLLNRQYTFKHEGIFGDTWIDYGTSIQERVVIGDFSSGPYISPFYLMPGFPTAWSGSAADFHLTATVNDTSTPEKNTGSFNGMWIWPSRYTNATSEQETFVQFRALNLGTGNLCIEAFTYDVSGNRSKEPARSGPCTPDAPPTAGLSHTWGGVAVNWSPVADASFYRVWGYDNSTGPARRESLIREVTSGPVLLGRPKSTAGFAVEACYASAPSCPSGATNAQCSTAQCSPLLEALWP